MAMIAATVAGCFVALSTQTSGLHQISWTSPELTPWPLPTTVTNGTMSLLVAGNVTFAVVPSTTAAGGGAPSALLARAVSRYSGIIEHQSPHSPVDVDASVSAKAVALTIHVSDTSEDLGQGTDESYSLVVPETGLCTLTAKNVFGALRGLESFSQLFEQSSAPSARLQMRGLPWTIHDSPRFSHRGVLIDSSRHYLPLETIRMQIDAMSYSKINLLHFHLVDFQSFPFVSEAAPQLSKGAWSPQQTYTSAELTDLVQYAKDRGVRIMVEIDTPGHSASWGVGYPDVITDCPNASWGGGSVALDPSNNKTFEIVEKLLSELNGIFPDTTFHLGGDEVRFDCWNESKKVTAFMRKQGFVTPTGDLDFPALEAYYDNRLLEIAARALPGRTLMMYQEVFDNGIKLPDKIVFGVWKSKPNSPAGTNNLPIPQEVSAIAKAGHQVVLANGNNGDWYLNDGFGNGNQVSSWDAVYKLDPLNGTNLTPEEDKQVIGGEVSLWGEEINENNLMMKSWPRAAAFAERMWSPRANTSGKDALLLAGPRLTRMHCKLVFRGIPSSPISPGSCFAKQ